MMQQKSIAVLSCYYGEFPWYFTYYLHSCRFNSTIDFFIITDNQPPAELPRNVKFVFKTLAEIRETASEKLQFNNPIGNAYKLCDYKPAYAFLFPEITGHYDFWAHSDIDIVYGDIRAFITDKILNEFDVISCRHDYITGSFCLFRNTHPINILFTNSRDYKQVFAGNDHFCFDECSFLWQELENGASIFDYPDHIQSMTWVVQAAAAAGRLKAFFDFIIVEGIPGNIEWRNGKIIYKKRYEAMMYHLVLFKKECRDPTPFERVPDAFYFTPKNIKQY